MTETIWSKADLHMHTTWSDGGHSVPELLAHVSANTDLDIIAITDHDCIEGALEARRLAPEHGLRVIIGQEVTTNRGHLLALFIKRLVTPGLSIQETVREVHAQGGLAILAHPFDRVCNSPMRHWPHPTWREWQAFGVDGLEAINGCQLDPRANPRALALGQRLGVSLTGGSDTHHKHVAGVAHTLFEGSTLADLREALERGTTVPVGRRWSLREYLGWVLYSLLPRTIGFPRRAMPVPSVDGA